PTKNIGGREPWIQLKELVARLKKRISRPRCITIAYSVNGGFTPMKYKAMGDEIASSFGYIDSSLTKRLRAGESFVKFREAFESDDLPLAKAYYSEALRLNSSYRAQDNNYGPMYLSVGKYDKARHEFEKMAKVDPNDSFSHSGLGSIFLLKGKIEKAVGCFKKALRLRKDNQQALMGSAEAAFRSKEYSKAVHFLLRYEKEKPFQGYSRYLEGKVCERKGRLLDAYKKYKEAFQLGVSDGKLLIKLVRLASIFDKDFLPVIRKEAKRVSINLSRFRKEYAMKGYREMSRKTYAMEKRIEKIAA
ncbi:MAG: tetratricopeptide repeat protein, partial [Candidatus Omnitrophica bacterium]|nr:tetratricopeptide repeat protein [Candidatus Omnitrophota bacterium]